MLRGGFLSAKERTVLQAVMRHPSEIHGVARRANAILLLDDGWNCAKVAEALYLDDVMDLSLCGVAFLWESSPASEPHVKVRGGKDP